MAMAIIEIPALIAALVQQQPAPTEAPPPPARTSQCDATSSTPGSDCCLHLPIWSVPPAPSSHPSPPAQTRATDERTKHDVEAG